MTENNPVLSVRIEDQISAGANAATAALEKLGDAAAISETRVRASEKTARQLAGRYDDITRAAAKLVTAEARLAAAPAALARGVETTEIDQGQRTRTLAKLEAQVVAARRALAELTGTLDSAGDSTDAQAAAARLLVSQYDKVTQSADRLAAAEAKLATAQDVLSRGLAVLGIDQGQQTRTLAALEAQVEAARRAHGELTGTVSTGATAIEAQAAAARQLVSQHDKVTQAAERLAVAETELATAQEILGQRGAVLTTDQGQQTRTLAALEARVEAARRAHAELTGTVSTGAAAIAEQVAAARQLASRYDTVTQSADRLAQAEAELATAQEILSRGVAILGIDQGQQARSLQALEARVDEARRSHAALTGTVVVGTDATKAQTAAVRNLGLQMFDVVPQLASGANVMTTLVQQGGQVAQVAFAMGASLGQVARGAAAAVLSINPYIAATVAVAAAVTTFGVVSELADRRQAQLRNTLRATRTDYETLAVSAEAAAKAVAATSGARTADARAAAGAFASQINFSGSQAQLETLIRTADDLAARLGIEMPEATAKMAAGMRSASGLARELEGKLAGFDSELTRTVGLQERAGKGAEAFNGLMAKIRESTAGASEQGLTPLGKSMRDLGNAFTQVGADGKSLAEAIGQTITSAAAAAVDAIAGVVSGIERLRQAAAKPQPRSPDEPRRGTINGARLLAAREGTDVFDAVAAQSTLPAEILAFGRRTMFAESSGRVGAVSPAGAIGLMGLMPATAAGLGVDPNVPADNVRGGLTYIAQLWRKYGGDADLVAMAFNWGPGNVDRFLQGAQQLADIPIETQKHVLKVTGGDLSTRFGGAFPTPPIPPTAGAATDTPSQIIDAALAKTTSTPTANREDAEADITAFRTALKLLADQGETTGSRVARLREALAAAAKTASEAATPTTKLAKDIREQAAAADRLARAYGISHDAVREVTAATQAEAAARSALGRDSPDFKRTVEELTAEYLKLAKAQAEASVAAKTRENADALELIRAESDAIGLNAEARDVLLVGIRAEQELKRQGIDIESDLGRAYVDSSKAVSQATGEFQRHQRALDAVAGVVESTATNIANSISNAFLTGEGRAVNFANIASAAFAQVANAALTLGAINPALNTIVGGQARPTLFDAFGGGSGGGGIGGIIDAGSNLSTLGSISDALGFTDFAGQVSSLGQTLGLTGSDGLLSGLSSGITKLLNTPLISGAATPGIEIAAGAQITNATAPSGLLSESAVAGNLGGISTVSEAPTLLSLGDLIGGVGVGFGAGSLAGGFVQNAFGKVGPAPQIGAGVGAIAGTIAGSFVPVIGNIIGGLIGGLVGGAGGGFIGPKAATPFSATAINVSNGSLAVGGTQSQLIDTTGEVSVLKSQVDQLNELLRVGGARIANGASQDQFGQNRLIGAQSGVWINIGQSGQFLPDLASAFAELRFTSDNPDFAGALDGRTFGTVQELNATLAAVNEASVFLNEVVAPLRIADEESSAFATQLIALNKQFNDAAKFANTAAYANMVSTETAAELVQAEIELVAARDQRINDVIDAATEGLSDTSGAVGAFERQLRDLNRQFETAETSLREARESGEFSAAITNRLAQAESDLAGARERAIVGAIDAATASATELLRPTGSANAQLAEIDRQFTEALRTVRTARESGEFDAVITERLVRAESDLAAARTRAEEQTLEAIRGATLNKLTDLNIRFANATLGRSDNPADRLEAQLLAFDDSARRQREAFRADSIALWSEGILATEGFAHEMALLERTLQAERLALVEGGNRDILAAESAATQTAGRLVTSLADFAAGLVTGPLTALSAQEQADVARERFETTAARAAAGDAEAVGSLASAIDGLLNTSRAINGTGAAFVADFDAAMTALGAVAAVSPDTLTQSVFVTETRTATETLAAAIDRLGVVTAPGVLDAALRLAGATASAPPTAPTGAGLPVAADTSAEPSLGDLIAQLNRLSAAPAPVAPGVTVAFPGALTESVFVIETRAATGTLTATLERLSAAPAPVAPGVTVAFPGALTESVFVIETRAATGALTAAIDRLGAASAPPTAPTDVGLLVTADTPPGPSLGDLTAAIDRLDAVPAPVAADVPMVFPGALTESVFVTETRAATGTLTAAIDRLGAASAPPTASTDAGLPVAADAPPGPSLGDLIAALRASVAGPQGTLTESVFVVETRAATTQLTGAMAEVRAAVARLEQSVTINALIPAR